MKFLEKIVEKMEPNFHKGGKYEKWFPVFDGFATFLFTPKETTKTRGGVHVRDAVDLKRTMDTVITALIPCLLFGIWNVGYQHYKALGLLDAEGYGFLTQVGYGAMQVLPLVIVSYVAGLATEFVFCIIKKHPIEEGFLVSGMLIPLIVPADIPLWMVAVATIFAVVFGKEVFGGTGMNILNPALTARAFLFFSYPKQISGDKIWVNTDVPDCLEKTANGSLVQQVVENGDTISMVVSEGVDAQAGATQLARWYNSVELDKALTKAQEAQTAVQAKIDTATGEALVKAKAALGDKTEAVVAASKELTDLTESLYSTADLAIGTVPGSIGETSAIAILIGAGLLLHTKVGSWKIMLSGLAGGLFMATVFSIAGANPYMSVNPIDQILAGGFLFGLVFMMTDPVSAAQTEVGKVIYGFFAGLFAIMIRVFNPAYPEGVMLAILFMNVMAPLIDHYVIQGNIKERLNRAKLHASH